MKKNKISLAITLAIPCFIITSCTPTGMNLANIGNTGPLGALGSLGTLGSTRTTSSQIPVARPLDSFIPNSREGRRIKDVATVITYVAMVKQEADQRQKAEAEAKAVKARAKRVQVSRKTNKKPPRYSAVKVKHSPKTPKAKKGKASVMIVDNHTGKVVDDKVYILEDKPKKGAEVKFGMANTKSATIL